MGLKKSIVEQVLFDPVHSLCPLPLRARLYPLGFPLDLETNATDVIRAASEGWGLFKEAYAFGWVTPAVAADHPVLRYRFLSTAMLTMVAQLALAPLHCALVARNGRGVALFGDSFAGKSTLAYACARVGWTFLSDDGTHLLRNSSDRYAIGDPYAMRFREDAKFLFPELADRLVFARP